MVDNLVPTDLRVDYLVDPLGLDNPTPSFSWRVESSGRGGLQRGYQVLVASSEALLDQDVGDLWDSGFVQAGNSVSVVYQGKPLESYAEYFWKVRVWDEQDQVSPYSAPARFEMGILDERNGMSGSGFPMNGGPGSVPCSGGSFFWRNPSDGPGPT